MQIIPVIDLKEGCVVHARHGDRANYRPLESPLCASSSILDVIDAFLDLYAFDAFYIADLNAINREGDHGRQIDNVVRRYKSTEFWLDNGCGLSDLTKPRPSNVTPVIGTESQQRIGKIAHREFVLSLDFATDEKLGNPEFFYDESLWPQNIILMTLSRVGSQAGPDAAKLAEYSRNHPAKRFIAAGGIRNDGDLIRLQEIGIDRALVASALHSGAIAAADIAKLRTKKYPV